MIADKLNKNWRFWDNKDSFALVWEIPQDARVLDLPHDAMIEEIAHADSKNGGNTGYRDGGSYSYAKLIDVPFEAKDETWILKFEGIYMNAMIYINGQLAAKNMLGYTDTFVPLNDFVTYGAQNEIRVQVRNSGMSNSRWYSGSGIYRDVYLLKGDLCHIVPQGVQIHCESIDDGIAVLQTRTEVKNRRAVPAKISIHTQIFAPDGTPALSEMVPVTIMAGEERCIPLRVTVDAAKLWSEDTPELYTYKVTLIEDDEVIDTCEDSFGIRLLDLDAKRGLRINKKTVKLRGACIHHDSGILGAATYEDAQYRQIKKMKDAGFNAVRMSHHPMSPAMLRACDRLGMYVMDESFDMWDRCKSDLDYGLNFKEWYEKDITAMVRKDYNHPCVIMYSIGNEIPEIGLDHGAKTSAMLSDLIHSLDATRYTLASINGIFAAGDQVPKLIEDVCSALIEKGELSGNINNFMALIGGYQDEVVIHPIITERIEKACASLDIAGYNYMTGRYVPDGKAYPNRVIVGSETYPQALAENWGLVKTLPYLIGDFIWTGWDYIGEAGIGIVGYPGEPGGFGAGFPAQLAYAGDIDITGFRRPTSYYHEIVYGLRRDPYIAVQKPDKYGQQMMGTPWTFTDAVESWNWKGFEGKPVVIEVYGAGDEVELLINGASKGRAACGESTGFKCTFDTIYEPGEVTAIAYKDGAEIGRSVLASAGEAVGIGMVIEDTLTSDELIYVNLHVSDTDGAVVSDTDLSLEVEITGDAKLLGLGSANPRPTHNFTENVTDTFFGRAQMVLKKTAASGGVKIHVKSTLSDVTREFTF